MNHHLPSGSWRNFPLTSETTSASLMLITPGRIAYSGLLGAPTERVFGAFALYIATNSPFTLWINGKLRQSYYEVIHPYTPHRISCSDKCIYQILVEAETIGDWRLGDLDSCNYEEVMNNIAASFHNDCPDVINCSDFDQRFFGRTLSSRSLDKRISKVVTSIRDNPADRHFAEAYAEQVGLSISRFTHLFREQTGTTLRRFCAWKRARGVMTLVKSRESLVETALSAGYADSTHLSHSIRHFFGLRPKDIFAGSRQLTLVGEQLEPACIF